MFVVAFLVVDCCLLCVVGRLLCVGWVQIASVFLFVVKQERATFELVWVGCWRAKNLLMGGDDLGILGDR
jgi:hypothetical protein